MVGLLLLIGFITLSQAATDDSLVSGKASFPSGIYNIFFFQYFTKSNIKFETHLTPEDFQRAKYVMSDTFATRKISDVDPLVKAGLFEGDIAGLDPQSLRDLASDSVARNAVINQRRVWDKAVVPYTISSEYSSYSRSQIAKAMDEYAQKTCIQFTPRQNEVDYIYIFPDDGCYSMVGKSGGRQTVSLGSGCVQKGKLIVQHK